MVHRKIKNQQLKAICKAISSFHKWRKLEITSDEETTLNNIKEIIKRGY